MNRLLLLALGLGVLLGCGPEPSVSGPSGTETGNAIQARLVLANGHGAAGARVVVRRAGAVDPSEIAVHKQADDSGWVRFRVAAGSWVMEGVGVGVGVRREFVSDSARTLSADTLRPWAALGLCLATSQAGVMFELPGLGRRLPTDAQGCVRWDSLPCGLQAVASAQVAGNWQVELQPGRTASFFQVASRPGAWFRAGGRAAWTGAVGLPVLVDLPSGSGAEEWRGPDGLDVPSALAWDRVGGARAWILPSAAGTWSSRVRVWGTAAESSLAVPGLTGLWSASRFAPSGAAGALPNLFRAGGSLAWQGVRGFDSLQGWYLESNSDHPLAVLDSSSLPVRGSFALLLHASLASTAVTGGTWFAWTPPGDVGGVRLVAEPLGLRLQAPGIDTLLVVTGLARFHAVAVSWNGRSLQLALDGHSRLDLAINLPDRTTWSRPRLGIGAGLRITQILTATTWDAAPLSAPPKPLTREN